ncbi:MAG: methyl-accepting chemotaxis protein [Proteobacteria bacterium]|nr:methyl-accepting chemotaxis protein [Pseudomonadota bacterium]
MKFQMQLKWKLTLGVIMVLIPVIIVLSLVVRDMLSSTNTKLFETIEKRAQTNARVIKAEITFELIAKLPEEIKNKIKNFSLKNQEAYAIIVYGKNNKPVSQTGSKIDFNKVIEKFHSLKKSDTQKVEDLVVAVEPVFVAAESGEAGEKSRGPGEYVGTVIYTESLADYYALLRRVVWMGVGASLAGILLITLGVFLIGHQSAQPIFRLVKAAQRIADGDLKNIEVEATGYVETTRLSGSIKSMAVALQKQVIGIKTLTNKISNTSRDVAGTMSQLASSASEQAAAVTETAATVEEMEQAGKSAAVNANQIVDAADKTTEASIRGREAVTRTNEIILRIKDDSQDISDKSKNLLSAVEEVGNIIRSVNSIAEQSKILAVNASIEAAKAGEYGSGFAVVAQEVKDLAQQSGDATLQITGTLTAIRQAIENMVETSQNGKERTEEGVNMITNAGAIMNDLGEAIRENSEFANVIATNINQQSVGLTQIATSIEEINSTALENQNISRKIVETTNQLTDSFDLLGETVDVWRTPDVEDIENS